MTRLKKALAAVAMAMGVGAAMVATGPAQAAPSFSGTETAKIMDTGASRAATDAYGCSAATGYSSKISYFTCIQVKGRTVNVWMMWRNSGSATTMRTYMRTHRSGVTTNDPYWFNRSINVPYTAPGKVAYVGRTWTIQASIGSTWAESGWNCNWNNSSCARLVISPTYKIT